MKLPSGDSADAVAAPDTVGDAFERAYFEHHLSREHGSMTRVAEKTGLERTHLYRKLKQLGIDLSKGTFRKGHHTSQ